MLRDREREGGEGEKERGKRGDIDCFDYILGLLHSVHQDSGFIREVSTLVKLTDFCFIPLVQIITSAPIRRYLA